MMEYPRAHPSREGESELDLTNAADELIEQHLESVRTRVLREVERARKDSFHDSAVCAEEITSAIQRIHIADARGHYWSKLQRALTRIESVEPAAFAAVSTLMFSAALSLLLLSSERHSDGSEPSGLAFAIGIAAALTGIVLARAFREFRRSRRLSAGILRKKFVIRMTRLEGDARQFAEVVSSPEAAAGGLAGVFKVLLEKDVWSEADTQSFRFLLRLRNAFVHDRVFRVPAREMDAPMAEVQRLHQLILSGLRTHAPGDHKHHLGRTSALRGEDAATSSYDKNTPGIGGGRFR